MLPLCFTFLVFIFLVLKLWMRSKIKDSPKNLPPAPWKLPLIGHLHLLMFSLPHHRLTELAKRYGSLMHLQLGELSHIVVSSPEAAKEVMKTHDISFATRPYLLGAEIIAYNFSDIGFAPYGDYWRQLRKVCTLELLSMKRVSCLIRSIYSNTGLEINLGEMLCNSSYNITLRTAFAARCKQHAAFISIVRKLVEAASGFSTTDLFPSVKLLPMISGMRAKLERWHHDLDAMLETIIEEHRAGNANLKDSDDVTDDLVDVLLNLQDHGGLEFPLRTDNIKAVILDMLIARTETSSTAVEWAMSELIKNPRILEKAQAEVRQVYDRTGDVNESDLHELKYLKLVMKETLRLHPPLPFLLPRESRKRCEINRYEIPAKTKVIVNAWAIGRDSNYWNEAERFYPERFIDSSEDMSWHINGMAVVELSLAQLLYHFDWKLPNGLKNEDLDMTETFGATSRRKRDLRLIPIPYCCSNRVGSV
ncbi:hypothetical protein ES332_A01G105300v1 [Gossypium tomentosum]|uniref:Cytochrome P450 n=1 Tax=Gossypium tomentosum TaxID=34277 RepID=A0A5D2RNZ5_GOSTO|nr:hypothetical protein ES332_A01G105300v1 [Gossypium tomentosum]